MHGMCTHNLCVETCNNIFLWMSKDMCQGVGGGAVVTGQPECQCSPSSLRQGLMLSAK